MDELEGNIIEGSLPDSRMSQFIDQLKECLVYDIESFMVTAARTKYRAVECSHRIKLALQTRLTQIDPEPEDFPLYAYNAKPFDILAKRKEDTNICSDVGGVVTKLTDVLPSKNNRDPRRQIWMENKSGTPAIVTLWGEHAKNFNASTLHEASLEDNMVVLFMGMIVSQFQGMLAFKSTALTRWHFNPPVPEVNALRESLEDQNLHYIIEWDGHDAPTIEPPETTLANLAKQKSSDNVEVAGVQLHSLPVERAGEWRRPSSSWTEGMSTGFSCAAGDGRATEDTEGGGGAT